MPRNIEETPEFQANKLHFAMNAEGYMRLSTGSWALEEALGFPHLSSLRSQSDDNELIIVSAHSTTAQNILQSIIVHAGINFAVVEAPAPSWLGAMFT